MPELIVPISEFKAKCLSLLEQIGREGGSVVVTKRGKPLAKVGPIVAPSSAHGLGSWKQQVEIVGDIVHVDVSADWENIS